MKRANVQQLDATTALEFWEVLAPHVERALAYDPYASISVDDVRRQVQEGYAAVFVAWHTESEALLMTTVTQSYERRDGARVLHVLATAGQDSRLWLRELVAQLKALAEQQGCVAVTMTGRTGWAKKLDKLGWRASSVTMEMAINEQQQEQERLALVGEYIPGPVSSSVPAGSAGGGGEGSDQRRSASGSGS